MICPMADQHSFPLYEKVWFKRTFQRVMDTFIFLLLLLLLLYRVFSFSYYSFAWFVAFLCELWFTYTWFVILSTKWSPAVTKTFLDSLLHRVGELPAVDLLVTTADPVLEPPIITVNTVLSLLALDYPAHKLACYVSDDGCSPFTFYALVEACKFAKLWVPFCKKHNVQLRAPFSYFSVNEAAPAKSQDSPEFRQEWLRMKDEYEELSRKVEDASRKSSPFKLEGEFAVFSSTERRNHEAIIKVIWNNKEGLSDGLPHLIYISREKRAEHPHHYKAGAMNALTRVSGLMTNAPFMLNVDCDMLVNNPKIVLQAMCIFLDSKGHKEVAFVQCPQQFYDGLKNDPFGNQWVAAFVYIVAGMGGLQGPYYAGTNCFHRRKVIYGLSPDDINASRNQEKLSEKELEQKFGSSKDFVKRAAQALEEKTYSPNDVICPSKFLEAATQVAGCGYEYGTGWGKQVGWLYGSLSEDVLTGLSIHRRGWRSEFCTTKPIAFTGCAPGGCLSTMTQQKRWASGLLVVLLSKQSPILGTLFGKIQFRECLGYLWITNWALRSVPELCYAALPAYCIITNSAIFPKKLGLWIPVSLFVIYNVYSLLEYSAIGLSIREWWNNQRMGRITTMNPWFLGFLSAIIKLLGISETVFEITKKERPISGDDGGADANAGRFTFDESPVFVPGTTMLLLQLTALIMKLLRLQPPPTQIGNGCGVGELFCSTYVVACYWPFLKGLFGKGEYGIPSSTVLKSAILSFLFVQFCRSTITGLDEYYKRVSELPQVDMFVATAHPELEPPILTMNTVLSLLAVDYPTHKLGCYVSDDGCSPLSYYALVEASKFATLWVPFCKNHNIQLRAPFG